MAPTSAPAALGGWAPRAASPTAPRCSLAPAMGRAWARTRARAAQGSLGPRAAPHSLAPPWQTAAGRACASTAPHAGATVASAVQRAASSAARVWVPAMAGGCASHPTCAPVSMGTLGMAVASCAGMVWWRAWWRHATMATVCLGTAAAACVAWRRRLGGRVWFGTTRPTTQWLQPRAWAHCACCPVTWPMPTPRPSCALPVCAPLVVTALWRLWRRVTLALPPSSPPAPMGNCSAPCARLPVNWPRGPSPFAVTVC